MKTRRIAIAAALMFAVGAIGVLDGAYFARNFVHDQLAEQKISFSPYEKDKEMYDAHLSLKKYAGKPVTNGWQANQYAEVIDLHVKKATGNKSYSEASAAARSNPTDQKLQEVRRTALDGQLLRGTLLNVYGWWWVGTIALWIGWGLAVLAVGASIIAVLAHMKARQITAG